jgi:sigma-B regulation protein RsbU (phosphoserine phosphatase)
VTAVLIVDDEPKIRDLLVRWLAEKYVISQAPDAETGLTMMQSAPADVVLCDIEMPGKGGLWLVQQLREGFPKSAVVLATGVDTIPPAISLQGGVVQYVVKPFTRERVLAAVAEAAQWQKNARAAADTGTPGVDPVEEWLSESTSHMKRK